MCKKSDKIFVFKNSSEYNDQVFYPNPTLPEWVMVYFFRYGSKSVQVNFKCFGFGVSVYSFESVSD